MGAETTVRSTMTQKAAEILSAAFNVEGRGVVIG